MIRPLYIYWMEQLGAVKREATLMLAVVSWQCDCGVCVKAMY